MINWLVYSVSFQDKWTSEPDLAAGKTASSSSTADGKSRGGGGWLQRHLSLKRKKSAVRTDATKMSLDEYGGSGLTPIGSQRCGSAPLLITISPVNSPPDTPVKQTYRRPSCIDGVVPVSIVAHHHSRQQQQQHGGAVGQRRLVREAGIIYEDADPVTPAPPPQILASDFDLGVENSRRIV